MVAPTNVLRVVLATLSLLIFTSIWTLLVRATQVTAGSYEFNTKTVVMFSEAVKTCISLSGVLRLLWRGEAKELGEFKISKLWVFAFPGLLYCINNNLTFYVMMYLDPPSYQVLQQLKVGTTAIAFRIFMGRELSWRKWIALSLLVLGCMFSQLEGAQMGRMLKAEITGYIFLLIQVSISGLAAVLVEKSLKETKQSIHLQNLQLYLFGTGFGVFAVLMDGLAPNQWFDGYNIFAYLSVLCLSLIGLATSAVMKYADNLIKVYTLAGGMVFTTFASAFLYGTSITTFFMIGTVICSVSCYLYFVERSSPSSNQSDALLQLPKVVVHTLDRNVGFKIGSTISPMIGKG